MFTPVALSLNRSAEFLFVGLFPSSTSVHSSTTKDSNAIVVTNISDHDDSVPLPKGTVCKWDDKAARCLALDGHASIRTMEFKRQLADVFGAFEFSIRVFDAKDIRTEVDLITDGGKYFVFGTDDLDSIRWAGRGDFHPCSVSFAELNEDRK
jgi:hypothetical protein